MQCLPVSWDYDLAALGQSIRGYEIDVKWRSWEKEGSFLPDNKDALRQLPSPLSKWVAVVVSVERAMLNRKGERMNGSSWELLPLLFLLQGTVLPSRMAFILTPYQQHGRYGGLGVHSLEPGTEPSLVSEGSRCRSPGDTSL